MRLGLLGSELRSLHLTTQRGGWLSAGANYRLFQLAASVFILLFTTSSIVSCAFIWRDWGRGQGPNYRLSQLEAPAFTLLGVTISSIEIPRTPHRLPPDAALRPRTHISLQIQIVERIPFHQALYFVIITLTTVGYGDVVAQVLFCILSLRLARGCSGQNIARSHWL